MRLLKAAGEVYCPDVDARRRLVKARVRTAQGGENPRDQSKLNETGIRKLRREKVFTTPNVFPPKDFKQEEVKDNPDFREVVEPQNCYICKKDYSHHPPFLRPALPGVRGIELGQAHRDGGFARARRAAHGRARENWLSGRNKTCCAPARN